MANEPQPDYIEVPDPHLGPPDESGEIREQSLVFFQKVLDRLGCDWSAKPEYYPLTPDPGSGAVLQDSQLAVLTVGDRVVASVLEEQAESFITTLPALHLPEAREPKAGYPDVPEPYLSAPDYSSDIYQKSLEFFVTVLEHLGYDTDEKRGRGVGLGFFEPVRKTETEDHVPTNNRLAVLVVRGHVVASVLEWRTEFNMIQVCPALHLTDKVAEDTRFDRRLFPDKDSDDPVDRIYSSTRRMETFREILDEAEVATREQRLDDARELLSALKENLEALPGIWLELTDAEKRIGRSRITDTDLVEGLISLAEMQLVTTGKILLPKPSTYRYQEGPDTPNVNLN